MVTNIHDAIDFAGRKWMLDVLFCFQDEDELRFHHIASGIDDVSNKTLSKRLKELEEEGFLRREEMQSSPPKTCYLLTDDGEDLLSCLIQLERCIENWQ